MILKNSHSIPQSNIVVLFVGVYDRKGLETAIRAMALLPIELQKRLTLLALGSGDRTYYASVTEQIGIHFQMTFVSNSKNVAAYYQAADIFLLPTVYEPFGMVTLEAMSCGLPPVVSRSSGCAELIAHGTSGFAIENPLSAAEIKDYLERLLVDEKFRKSMGLEARKIAVDRSWDQVAKEYDALLRKLSNHG